MSEIYTSKYIDRAHAIERISEVVAQHSAKPVEQGENAAYRLGHALGYSDALKDAMEILRTIPEAKKPDPLPPYNHYR